MDNITRNNAKKCQNESLLQSGFLRKRGVCKLDLRPGPRVLWDPPDGKAGRAWPDQEKSPLTSGGGGRPKLGKLPELLAGAERP